MRYKDTVRPGTVQVPYRYRPARLDLNESGIIEKPLKRTSTAISFYFFNFTLEYFKRLQSSEPLHAKFNPILLLVRFTVCIECCLPIGWRTVI